MGGTRRETERRPRAVLAALAAALVAAAVGIGADVGCGFGDVDLDGKACNAALACADGYVCDESTRICVRALSASSGAAGSGGTSGTGTSGDDGTSGSNGSNGSAGTSGSNGSAGASGSSGSSGSSGNPTGPLWIAETSGTTVNLQGVAVGDDGKAYAVGNGVLLVRSTSGEWSPANANGLNLIAVAADGSDVWAVASNGKGLRSNDAGDSWSAPLSLTSTPLTGVAVRGGYVTICGAEGVLQRGVATASSLSSLNFNQPEGYVGVGMATSERVFATTEGGRVVERLPAGGYMSRSANIANFGGGVTGLSATPEGDVWISSGSGRVEHVNVNGQPRSVSGGRLRAIWAKDSVEVFTVGDAGTIFVRDAGDGWVQQRSPVTAVLRAVSGNAAGLVLAVGDAGTILRRP